MYNHVCEASQFKNQGRCCICGRFMSAPNVNLPANCGWSANKEHFLNLLRNGVYLVKYERAGVPEKRYVTLMPSYLSDYVGKGTYKKAINTDKIFAYDVDEERFCGIDINTITDFEIS
jgi:hypothetical protein